MQYTYKNQGVCSRETIVDIDENTHVINDVKVVGGCDGNLQGVSVLLKGMKAEDAISRMSGIKCGFKQSSCPDQVSKALEAALSKLK
ncbi:MAG: TIGR03905 family TSCPD domain-containing protein [Clostridia bacterium]|nr:TIGR03905 family TSCPD domain-containing protein [Clostridia bacterium]